MDINLILKWGLLPIALIVGWIVLLALFTGVGSFLLRTTGRSLSTFGNLFHSFWLGIVTIIALSQIIHLFIPISTVFHLLFVAGGVAGLLLNFKDILTLSKRIKLSYSGLFLIVPGIVALLIIANQTLGQIGVYDAGLYHIQQLFWTEQYQLLPGLANIHSRFGFNSSYFLLVATQQLFSFEQSFRLSTGVIMLALFGQIALSLYRLSKNYGNLADRLMALSSPLLVYMLFASPNYLTSFSPDFGVIAITLVTTYYAALQFVTSNKKEHDFALFMLLILAAVGAVIKLSFAAFGGVLILVAVFIYWKQYRSELYRSKLIWLGLIIALVISITWMARGIIISGYPLYPSTALSFLHPDWQLSEATAIDEANWVQSWARQPGLHWNQVLGSFRWVLPWANNLLRDPIALMLLITGGTLAVFKLLLNRFKGNEYLVQKRYLALWLPVIAGLLFWFILAPDIRFTLGTLWLGVSLLTLMVLPKNISFERFLMTVMGLGVIFLAFTGGYLNFVRPSDLKQNFATDTVQVNTYMTQYGVEVSNPAKGDQCWFTPIPCSPTNLMPLQLRDDNSFKSGFRK